MESGSSTAPSSLSCVISLCNAARFSTLMSDSTLLLLLISEYYLLGFILGFGFFLHWVECESTWICNGAFLGWGKVCTCYTYTRFNIIFFILPLFVVVPPCVISCKMLIIASEIFPDVFKSDFWSLLITFSYSKGLMPVYLNTFLIIWWPRLVPCLLSFCFTKKENGLKGGMVYFFPFFVSNQ